MGCNCKKNNSGSISKPTRSTVTPKGRGVNNGKVITNVKRGMRRQIK